MAQGGDRLFVDPGHQARDARLCPQRLAGGARRVDRSEVPHLVGLRRQYRNRIHPRPTARGYQLLLVHRHDRLVIWAQLRGQASAVTDSLWAHHRRPDRVCPVPGRDPASAPVAGATDLHRYPALDRDAARRPFRRAGAAGGARQRGARVLPAAAASVTEASRWRWSSAQRRSRSGFICCSFAVGSGGCHTGRSRSRRMSAGDPSSPLSRPAMRLRLSGMR